MTFVYPSFLWAFAAVAIPVIIHLFNFRRYKKVYFSNVRFLRELQLESKSRSRLKELLVLLSRCLLIASLVLAFAQPVLPGEGKIGKKATNDISIYIDNSFSMDNVSRQGPMLQIAKTQARSLVNSFGNADRFQLITNDFEGRHQRFHTREDVISLIEEVKLSPARRLLSEVVSRQSDFLSTGRGAGKKIFLFSDAQKSTFNLSELKADSSTSIGVVALQANQVNNVALDSCWFETPLQQKGFIQKLHVRIRNFGESKVELGTARLKLNNQQVAISSYSLEAGATSEVQFIFENKQEGLNFGSVKIEDYPVSFDDELFFAFNSAISVRVALINGKDIGAQNPFASLFASDSLFVLKNFSEQAIDFGAFKNSDVIVLNQLSMPGSGLGAELEKFSRQGGVIVIVPSETAAGTAYQEIFSLLDLPRLVGIDTNRLRTDKIEYASRFYTGVFEKIEDRINLPVVNRHFTLAGKRDFESIISLQNGDVFLGTGKKNNAAIYLFSTPFSEKSGNFQKHALFVPTFYRIAFSSLRVQPLSYATGENVVISLKSAGREEMPPHIVSNDKQTDIIPEVRNNQQGQLLYTRGQVQGPGHYVVMQSEAALMPLAFNYSRIESNLESFTPKELQEIAAERGLVNFRLLEGGYDDIGKQVLEAEGGKKLWKIFLILAIAFLIIEAVLLRVLK